MKLLVDTNVLLRYIHQPSPEHSLVMQALRRLDDRSDLTVVTPQNLIELWGACTRPAAANGLGLPVSLADQAVERVLRTFDLLEDDPVVFLRWRKLVNTYQVLGRQVHDARLVAVILTYGFSGILTFNPTDFTRYTGIQVLHPAQV